jgi:hypothetical protein
MTLQELQKQVLQLPTHDRWQLVQALLESLKQETEPKRGNLSRLKGIAKTLEAGVDAQLDEGHRPEWMMALHPWTQALVGVIQPEANAMEEYVDYLEEKYR